MARKLSPRPLSRKYRRLWILVVTALCLGGATALTLHAFSDNIVFFVTPSQLGAHPPSALRNMRLGGMVMAGSLRRQIVHDVPQAEFEITDGQAAIKTVYQGILPDLFREGQSIVALGHLQKDGTFQADEVLAKHDETYMPREIAEELQKSGKWDPRFGPPPDMASWNSMIASHPARKSPSNPVPADKDGP